MLRKSWWSYCCQIHAVSASIATSSAAASPDGWSVDGSRSPLRSRGASGRSYSGASSWRDAAGTSPTTVSPSSTRSAVPSVTVPTTRARTSHRSQIASTSSRSPGSTMASIRSWLSEVMISNGSMPGSRCATADTSTSIPTPPRLAVSLVAQHRPAPPRSWMPTTRPASRRARQASMSRFSSNGSPTCTLGRLAASASASPKPAEASTETPPIPSRPVVDPRSTARLPGPLARPSTNRSAGMIPRHSTLTSGLPS